MLPLRHLLERTPVLLEVGPRAELLGEVVMPEEVADRMEMEEMVSEEVAEVAEEDQTAPDTTEMTRAS